MAVGERAPIAFLLDVDNTLLDNDRLKADIAERVERLVGPERALGFWELYEEVRRQEDYVDYPATVERWKARYDDPRGGRAIGDLLEKLAFKSYVYPGVPETIQYLWTMGTVGILSDGDTVFQPKKISGSGLEAAVKGNVLIFVHKEQHLPEVFRRLPADHYVVVDDKERILAALERDCPTTFTTVFVLQGRYAVERQCAPMPDYTIEHIADLRNISREQFLKA